MDPIRVEIESGGIHAWIGDRDVSEEAQSVRLSTLRPYLPREWRNVAGPRQMRIYSALSVVSNHAAFTIPQEVLAEALRAWLTAEAPRLLGQTTTAESVSVESLVKGLENDSPSYLTIGGQIFKLTPEMVSAAPAKMLATLRRKVAEEVARDREALLQGARAQAQVIMEQADARRREVAAEAQRLRIQQATMNIIPDWIGNLPVSQLGGGQIAVRLPLYYAPSKFTYPGYEYWEDQVRNDDGEVMDGTRRIVDLEWSAIAANPVQTAMWLKFDRTTGVYDLGGAFIDRFAPALPHANHSGFCCQPQGLPPLIQSEPNLRGVVAAVQRTFQEVNLASLLTAIEEWSPEVKAFMPDGVQQFMDDIDDGNVQTDDLTGNYNCRIAPRETPGMIWQTGRETTR